MSKSTQPQINRWQSHRKKERRSYGFIFALIFAVVLHLALFAYLKRIEFFNDTANLEEEQIHIINTDTPEVPEVTPEATPTLPEYAEAPEEIAELDEILLEMKNQDLDINTSVEAPEIAVNMSLPAKAGDLQGTLDDIILNTNTDAILEDIGTAIADTSLAAEGQLVIQQGAMRGDILDQRDLIDDKALLGIEGLADDGILDGYSSLDSLLSMSNLSLDGSRTALPSDLLFEYDSAELKEEARLGLLKLGMLIERNPEMYCLLEGHTDLFGSDSYNLELSQARALAVKSFLVISLRLDESRILTKGFGKTRPVVTQGDQIQQSPNRRVDILMRNSSPPGFREPVSISPSTASLSQPTPVAEPPVQPKTEIQPVPQRAIVIDEDTPTTTPEQQETLPPSPVPQPVEPQLPQRAIVVEEPPKPKAITVQPQGDPAARFLEVLEDRGIRVRPVRAIVVD